MTHVILKTNISGQDTCSTDNCYISVLIDGHTLIKALGKPNGCQTFGEYADAFLNVVRSYFDRNKSRVDVVFDRHIGEDSINAST